jgi:formylglycine-generating enzyme required for sulfatase activity
LTNGFYLGKYEVTQAQYEAVMTGNSDGLSATPSNWPNNADRPVEKVSWDDIQKFLTRLNAQESGNIPSGWSYVLPTEAQWEYACRAGTTTVYSWGDSITTSNANYNSNIGQTADVGQYSANPWGFFDMHGNVWEWTADWYGGYSSGAQTDPEGPASGSYRVGRGGSWGNTGTSLRSAFRYDLSPSYRGINIGFRVGFQQQSADVASPEMSILGDANITQLQGVAWVDPGVEAHDVRDGNLTSSVSVSGTVDVNATGTYTLTYTVSDAAGNQASLTRTVTVVAGQASTHTADLNASVSMEMIWVQPGSFTMGQDGVATPEHNVTLTKGFYLGKYEVTQAQYEAVMTGNSDGLSATPSNWPNNADRPVEKVSWDDIQKFLTRLNAQESGNIPAGWSYVLPTEAQWEYACRAGTTTVYSWGDNISASDANYNYNIGQTADVGQYSANPWGFFDMHGNVWEWTADWYGGYSSGAQTDPEGSATGSYRVLRGGSWDSPGADLRSASRINGNPGYRGNGIGVRVGFQQQSADVASPEMSILGDANITQLQGVAWVDPGVEAHDVRDGNLTSSVSVSGTVDVNATGTYTLTYTVSDAAGNQASLTRTVTVGTPATYASDLNASVSLEMIWVQPGSFTMGSPTTEVGRQTNETEHNVTLTKGFYLGKYEVTQAQYEAVMTGNSDGLSATPSNWPNNAERPIEMVSWDDIQKFLTRLNAQESGNIPAGWSYVLPTEAQWEYACRAGTTTAYSWGDDISASDANWNHGNDANQTENVGQYAANPWGIFDMHGNVWEWTADWYGGYSSGSQTDPEGSASGSVRVVRGGSWPSAGTYLRSAFRNGSNPSNRTGNFGFRVGFQEQSADVASPEMSILGDANITQLQGVAWVDPGVEAHDVRDGNLTSSVSVSGTVDVNATGTYTLTYTVSDAAGNQASLTRTVTVGTPATYASDLNASVSLEMIWVQPGTFTMGQDGVATPEHNVTLTKGFYLGKYEVTQAQYEAVMTGNSDGLSATPSQYGGNADRPVEKVSWDDIQKFLTRLNAQESGNIPAGWAYVLPTEAQWEYACRAGTTTAYSWGVDINSSNANYNSNIGQTADVGQYAANPWGFFDMHGNVREWTADRYAAYSSGAQTDPEGSASGFGRVFRGGSWVNTGPTLRSAYRTTAAPSNRGHPIGFRVGFQHPARRG